MLLKLHGRHFRDGGGFFEEIERQSWTVAYGGKNDTKTNGYFINPTIIDNPLETSRIAVEEPFGTSNTALSA